MRSTVCDICGVVYYRCSIVYFADVVAIVVPVCIVFMLIVLAVALFLYLRRRK